MAPCHITLRMSSVHAVRTGYGDTSSPSDGTSSVSSSVPPPVPTDPPASMNRIGPRHDRNVRDLSVGPVASAYVRRRISASARWERGFPERIRALSSANDHVQTGGMLTADVISSCGLKRMNTAIKFRIDLPNHELSTNPARTPGRATSKIFSKCARNLYAALAFAALACVAPCQEISRIEPTQADPHMQPESSDPSERESRHILGILPNYRTFPSLYNYEPLTSREKFKIASEDSLDRGTFVLGALFGGLGQLTDSNKSFGRGGAGFARYFGASYGDLLIGNYMSEAVYPSILHQDPRYFRRGAGSGRSRFAYAISQIFWTHRDSGGSQFNYSEWLGNSTAVAISNAYYPDQRSAGSSISKLAMQIGVDAVGNVLKEFWPDLRHKFSQKSPNQLTAGGK